MAKLINDGDAAIEFDRTHTAVSIEQIRKEVHERNVYRKAIEDAQDVLVRFYKHKIVEDVYVDFSAKECVEALKLILLSNHELIKLMREGQDG